MPKKLNLLGEKYHLLTVIKEVVGVRRHGSVVWECLCDCGGKREVPTRWLREGITTSCGCRYRLIGNKHPNWTGYKEISGAMWKLIKRGAKKRKLEFSIDLPYVWELFLKQKRCCALTGMELKFRKTDTDYESRTASLDRINSSKGYIKGNVQWVHKDINNMKWNFDEQYFIDMCKKIVDFNNLKTWA